MAMTIAPGEIRSIARQQHLMQVEFVELSSEQRSVSIRIVSTSAGRAVPAAGEASAGQGIALDAATDLAGDGDVVIKAQALGLFRRTHPLRPHETVTVGDVVPDGHPLALLQVRDAMTSVNASSGGAVIAILAQEGQLVDFGMPLFRLRPQRG